MWKKGKIILGSSSHSTTTVDAGWQKRPVEKSKKEKENRTNPGANGVAVSGAHLQRGCPEL